MAKYIRRLVQTDKYQKRSAQEDSDALVHSERDKFRVSFLSFDFGKIVISNSILYVFS